MKLLSRIQDETAQGVVEFAFIVSILMLLFLGTVDYARFLYYDAGIRSAARVGAETASNHCPFADGNCGTTTSSTADTYVLWSTYCEGAATVQLTPAYTTCHAGSSSTWTPTCASGSCTNCTGDICVDRSGSPDVTVSVGYSFHPIAFFLNWAFTEQSCYSADSVATNHHTLCASSTGKIS